MTGRPDDPSVPSYLPPWPTEWPDTMEEAEKVVAAMNPRPSRVAITVAIACVIAPLAIVAFLVPQSLAFIALAVAIALGAGGARMKQPMIPTDWRRR